MNGKHDKDSAPRALPPIGPNKNEDSSNDLSAAGAMADSLMDDISRFVEENCEAEIIDEERDIR